MRAFSYVGIGVCAAVLAASACQGTDKKPSPAPRTETVVFESFKTRSELTVELDRIGIAPADGVSGARFGPLAETLGLTLDRVHDEQIFVYSVPGKPDRAELHRLARRIERVGRGIVGKAGLVLVPEGAKKPMLLTDQIVIEFQRGTAEATATQMLSANALSTVQENPFVTGQYLAADSRSDTTPADVLALCEGLEARPEVRFCHPNFIPVVEFRQTTPNDPLYGNQWHHANTGQSGGTVDADIDTDRAWDFTMGSNNVVIAVIDGGFDAGHPDLTPNLWVNTGEIAGNGVDDDANGFVDDINGWNFNGGSNNLAGGNHGTAVAGCAGARGNNNLGVSGSCPICQLMLIRVSLAFGVFNQGVGFAYAQNEGAQIITNSWGYPINTPATANVTTAINAAATNGRGGLGCVVLFAMNNINTNDCLGTTPDISSLPNVIAVSRATNQDQFSAGGFGFCMDLLGPTAGGTLSIATTGRRGNPGYNNASPPVGCADVGDGNYTLCFNGTSAATPIVAGVAGLILDRMPNLTRAQVQQLLQDTADKVQVSLGAYSTATGFSAPTGPGAAPTHGYGRVNAFEAVRIAAPVSDGGRGGVDVFLRDNRLDWGNTAERSNVLFESPRDFIGHWRSEDIKVDAPPYQTAPTTSLEFESFTNEAPVSTEINKVYVRVHNRGPASAADVTLKLHWAFAGTALPALPGDFWATFPADSADTSKWHPIGTANLTNLSYSGCSVATTAADASQIATFDWIGPPVDTSLAQPRHHCLFAVLDSPQDQVDPSVSPTPFVVDSVTPRLNNVTHRNFQVQDPSERSSREAFYVRNPYAHKELATKLTLEAPRDWRVTLGSFGFDQEFILPPGAEVLVKIQIDRPDEKATGEVSITQSWVGDKAEPMAGGLVFAFGS